MATISSELTMQPSTLGAIDCDLHPALAGTGDLLPYLDDHWREQMVLRGIDGMDLTSFVPTVPANGRPDWRPKHGKPGSDLAMLRDQALSAFGSRFAICNCLYGGTAALNPHMAAAMCRATNEWMAHEWLDREPRLRGSITVPMHDIGYAVEEIERCAADQRFVQVLLLAMGETPLGRRQYWPIYEAAQRHRLPVCIHAGSAYRFAVTSNGWPSHYLEDYVVNSIGMQSQLLSLVFEGVFAEFPQLRVVMAESGFTWLPNFLWRVNKTWRGLRAEVPWVRRPPADIIREHVRFTLQPTDAPADPHQMQRTIEQIGSDDVLLFSTDYPHWHFDDDKAVLPEGLPAELVQKILIDNPLATYPRLKDFRS